MGEIRVGAGREREKIKHGRSQGLVLLYSQGMWLDRSNTIT